MSRRLLCVFLTIVFLTSALFVPTYAADASYAWIIQPKFDGIRGYFHESAGSTVARLGDKWGLIDVKGNWVVLPQFDDMGWGGFSKNSVGESLAAEINGKWGLIDSTGKWVVQPQFDLLYEGFGSYTISIAAAMNDKWGLINSTGKWVVQPEYDDLWEGFSSYTELVPAIINDKWGFIDSTGKWVIKPQFEEIDGSFYEGTIAVAVRSSIDGMEGMIDSTGKWVIEPQFEEIDGEFDEGTDIIPVKFNDKWGLIDTKGNWVVQPVAISADKIAGFGINNVSKASKNNKWGFIDITNNWIIQPQFDEIEGWSSGGIAIVTSNGKFGMIHSTDLADASNSYIYDSEDPGAVIDLPYETLENVVDKTTAVIAITDAVEPLTPEEKASSSGVDSITLFSEEAIAQSSTTKSTSNKITINEASVAVLANKAVDTKAAAVEALSNAGISYNRELNTDVKFKTTVDNNVTVTIDKTAMNTKADSIRVETPSVAVSINSKALKADAGDTPLVITIAQTDGTTAYDWLDNKFEGLLTVNASNKIYTSSLEGGTGTKTYTVSFNKAGLEENIKVSLPRASGNVAYQAVLTADGNVVGGKYNPATDKIDIRTKTGGNYVVKENKKDFADILNKSEEMQEAIRVMTSKGIMGGTTEKEFSPDQTISRAEIASYLLKTFSKLDLNADSGYSDVKKSDWYSGAAGSAKKYGIFEGFPDNTFRGTIVIPKEQMMAVAARTLRVEMKYKDPTDIQKYISIYEDNSAIENWAETDIAFATRENLIMKRTDNKFLPKKGMTRGDAAIMLKRLFDRVW